MRVLPFLEIANVYDVKFGRKKATEADDEVANGHNGNSSNVTSNGNGHLINSPELAVYEQFRIQDFLTNRMGLWST
ncbi:hypothetical protein Acr_00g0084000 [Actinidia rufa]|uniref:Uncharacterized protein n=1 Tax=Actinidia rufa TaxID=165716 RepID=A0A7J0DV01_9ERIC|nr:hypothetical protein Acr_00g0084000 [Actinidia rufa]